MVNEASLLENAFNYSDQKKKLYLRLKRLLQNNALFSPKLLFLAIFQVSFLFSPIVCIFFACHQQFFPATLRPAQANICKNLELIYIKNLSSAACFALWLDVALVFVFAVTFWGCGLVLGLFLLDNFFMTELLEGALSDFQKHSKKSRVFFFMANIHFQGKI